MKYIQLGVATRPGQTARIIAMSGNSFGKLFTVTSFGESHGPALGAIVDGCPPGLELSEADLQADLDRRKPGTSRHTTQRREADEVKILSGVFEGKTTGTPIGLLIENTETGKTLARNNLKIIETIFESTACLIGGTDSISSTSKNERIKSITETLRAAVELT